MHFPHSQPGLQPFVVDTTETTILGKKWKLYRQELDLFLAASGITQDAEKRAILLHASGKNVREIFSTFDNTGTTYEETCAKLDTYFSPQKNLIYERWIFRNVKQTSKEDCLTYITRLRKLVENCEYTDAETEVRDQFVCSCYNPKLREKFL